MKKQLKKKQTKPGQKPLPHFLTKRLCEGSFILILTTAVFVLLSLATYQSSNPSILQPTQSLFSPNAGGQVGALIAQALYFSLGYLAYLLPVCIAYLAGIVLTDHHALRRLDKPALLLRGVGLLLLLIGGCGLLNLRTAHSLATNYSGGILGNTISTLLTHALSLPGTSLLLLAILLIGITLLTGISWIRVTELIGFYTLFCFHWIFQGMKKGFSYLKAIFALYKNKIKRWRTAQSLHSSSRQEPKLPTLKKLIPKKGKAAIQHTEKAIEPIIITPPTPNPATSRPAPKTTVSGRLPSLSLLDKEIPGKAMGGYTHQELETLSREVEQYLLDFGIHADVVAVHPGPVITRFELQLAAGIKVSRLTALAKDLARSLSVTSVRVVEVIPGKTVVGLELPNQYRAMVRLSSVLSADIYQHALSPLILALGVDIAGHPMAVDLAKMPHLLVAGTTGSGKSVGINAMILSLLFKATPEQVRLIMIDPKMLELSVYDGIPHLLTPVVTDMKEAANALRWCVGEMERRYRLMAALGVRNLAGFNTKITEAMASEEPLIDPLWKPTNSTDTQAPYLQPLPYVVVIIDELADMMMVVGKKVEQLIARIAQKARAAGIHLILATQRPSVDVLTGLIKSNIPTRMSFQVSSKIDSRTILDQQGAEQLLGHGDMLYLAPGSGAPLRVHGAFVDDQEVHRIADDWRARGEPAYIDEITQITEDGLDNGSEEVQDKEDVDPLYDEAVAFVLQTRKASISAVQRRLKIGYNRAARLVEEMERVGLIGPLEGGTRDVLVPTMEE